MFKITLLSTIAGALLACSFSAAPVQAGPNLTWVSGTGTDSGACTRAAPCRTFAFALTQTVAGGEIDVLDPAGYNPVTITKAISIVNDGVGTAVIGAPSGNAITINAGPSDNVLLRGLTINGFGSGTNGIQFKTGLNLAIENCVVLGFTNAGIDIAPTSTSSVFTSSFSVSNTIASNNNGGNLKGTGILVQPPAANGIVTGVLSQVTANNNSFVGISVDGSLAATGSTLNVTIVDSVASNNGSGGVAVNSNFNHPTAAVMLRNSVVSYNGDGLLAQTNTILRVAHSVVTGNTQALFTSGGGLLDSYGDNDIDGNINNNTGLLTTIAPH